MKLLPFLESCAKKKSINSASDWTERKVPEVSVNNEDTTFTLEVPELRITACCSFLSWVLAEFWTSWTCTNLDPKCGCAVLH